MTQDLILFPVFAMVLLSALVWGRLYVTRIREIRSRRIRVGEFKARAMAAPLLVDVAGPADNFMNLFELPVLFYVVTTLLYVMALVDSAQLVFAWTFVVFRYLHSFIHVTYNKVLHRFAVYAVSSFALWAMWIWFGWQWIGRINTHVV